MEKYKKYRNKFTYLKQQNKTQLFSVFKQNKHNYYRNCINKQMNHSTIWNL